MASYSREEHTNWYRVCRLLTEGGTGILIDFLKQSIGSYTLDSYLASKRNDVNKVKQLHQPQKDILYPPGGGNTDTRQWDITLISCIINKLIKPADPLQKSSIDDIRQLRNEIFGHCGELRMNQSEFQTNWSRIKQVLSKASVVLLHNVGSFALTSLEEDIENDEVTNIALNQMKHILDNWMQCDIVGGLSEVKSYIERQIEWHSEVKSIVEGVKSAVEKQTEGHSEVKSVVEEVKSAVEKQTKGHSEVMSIVEGVKSAVEKHTEGQSELKCFVERQAAELLGLKSVIEGMKNTLAREDRACSEIKDSSCSNLEGQGPASMQSQSPNDQVATAENIPMNPITTGEGLQTRTCLPPDTTDELRILLIGKEGDGKSATGNTILGEDAAFDSRRSPSPVTRHCHFQYGKRFGRKLLVMDTPGLCDTTYTEIKRELTQEAIEFDVISFVLRVGRFTPECSETKRLFFDWFGGKSLKRAFIILTHWNVENRDFTEYFNQNPELKTIKQMCGNRVVGIENSRPEGEKTAQVEKMFEVIDKIKQKVHGKNNGTMEHLGCPLS